MGRGQSLLSRGQSSLIGVEVYYKMVAKRCIVVVTFLLSLGSVCVEGASFRAVSAVRTGPWQFQIVEGFRVDGVLLASLNNTINETG